MHIVGLLGSPRGNKSNTLRLLESALAGCRDAGAATEVIDVTRCEIKYCIGCERCYATGRCILEDDFHSVYDKMLAADGVILASPVYFNSVSAQLKAFIDRTADCRHCMRLDGKYGMSIATTASSGEQRTLDYMNEYLTICGANVVGGVSTRLPMIPKNMEQASQRSYEMGAYLVAAHNEKRAYPEQEATRMAFVSRFKYAVQARKDVWVSEYDYFLKKGWIEEGNCAR